MSSSLVMRTACAFAMLLAVTQVCSGTSTTYMLVKSSLVVSTICCYNCPGCDAKGTQRYNELAAIVQNKANSTKALCKQLKKCRVANGPSSIVSKPYVTVTPYLDLAFQSTSAQSRVKITLKFLQYAGISVNSAGLSMTSALLEFPDPTTYFSANGSGVSLTQSSQIRGILQSFSTSFSSLNLTNSAMYLKDTPILIANARWSLVNSSATISWTAPVAAARPAYLGSAPLIVYKSTLELKSGFLRIVNVTDAFFLYSTLAGDSFLVELINSNVRFMDCQLLYKNVFFMLTNSTLQLSYTAPSQDKYLAAAIGLPKLTNLPRVASPRLTFSKAFNNNVNVSGSGSLTFMSTPK